MSVEPTEVTRLDGPVDRTPASVEAQVMQINADSPLDELAAAMDAADWMLARAKSIDALMKQLAIAWIDTHGAFIIGDIEYSVGYSTTVKCLDVRQTGHTLLEAVAGDFDQFMTALAAQPFKHGTVKSFIQQKQYASLFRSTRTGRLVHGVPERVLKRTDQRFVKLQTTK
ncbi:hypothetical protein BH09PLA1_BH09PLA1_25150 [soil metagenome]